MSVPARPAPLFADIDDVAAKLAETGYLPDTATATAVFLADRLGKPILVAGPAGVGKTEPPPARARSGPRRWVGSAISPRAGGLPRAGFAGPKFLAGRRAHRQRLRRPHRLLHVPADGRDRVRKGGRSSG